MVQKAGFHNLSGTMSLQSQNSVLQQVTQRSLTVTIVRPMQESIQNSSLRAITVVNLEISFCQLLYPLNLSLRKVRLTG